MKRNTNKALPFLGFLIGFSFSLNASPQIPDYLIFQGDTFPTYNLILEQYLQKWNVPDQGKLFGMSFREGSSFQLSCWRGYQAIYGIENDSLFLIDLIRCGEINQNDSIDKKESISKMQKLFGNKILNGKVFMDWFSGDFSIPKGEGELLRWDGVFYCIFETEILFKSENGIITQVSEISNYEDFPDRIDRRDKDTIADVIFHELQKIKWKEDLFCTGLYLITIDINGEVHGVLSFFGTDNENHEASDISENNYCIETIETGLKDLKFDILRDKGIPAKEKVRIRIWFEDDGSIRNW